VEINSNNEKNINYLNRANHFKQQGKLSEAIVEYRQASNLTPNDASIHQELGTLLKEQGRLDEAISCYRQVATLSPSYKSFVQLGYLLRIQHKSDEAATFYIRAIELEPRKWDAYGLLIQGVWKTTEADYITTELQKIIQNNSDNTFLYLSLGRLLTRQGKIDHAIDCFQKGSNINAAKFNSNFAKFQVSEDSVKFKAPNFLIVGSGKSGTSSLHQYLSQHPQVLSPVTKEIGFFDLPGVYVNGIRWYLSHFPQVPVGEKFVTGEASPGYLYRHDVEKRVFQAFPNVKLIVMMRNPVHRTISAYHHSVRWSGELRSLEEVVDAEIEMVQGMSDPSDLRKSQIKFEPRHVVWSMYYYFLKNWMNVFPRDQFLVLKSEDFFENPERVLNQVFNFLDLPNFKLPNYPVYQSGGSYEKPDKLQVRLSDFFEPHNQCLEEYLCRQFDWE
jgi:tetratricopeptide (TPR) repeat protein